MIELNSGNPQDLAIDADRWQAALAQIDGWCRQGELPAASLVVVRNGGVLGPHHFGRQTLSADSPPLREDAIFLVASITKPIVAMGALRLVEQGLLSLDDRVEKHIPEFGQRAKHAVTVRNLLTHTSGLPDMLPQNRDLRHAHSPLSGFVEGACQVGLDFPPGRGVQYQSMGFAILGEILSRVCGVPCSQFLRDELFQPLRMLDTALGAPDEWFSGPSPKIDRVAEIRVPAAEGQEPHWGWNSRYWRQLGAPWGGLLTTPMDLVRFVKMMLQEGTFDGRRVLSPAGIRAATRNQLEGLREISADDRRCRPWGLGWRLNWPAHSANFGELLGPRAYGHWGATGTALWIDPDLDAAMVFLTTQPQEPHGTYLARAANLVLASFV